MNWQPGPTQGHNHDRMFSDGEQLLVAVPVCIVSGRPDKGYCYQYSVVRAYCDPECFSLNTAGDDWGWEWSDVEWFVPMAEIAAPKTYQTPKA